MKSPLQSAIKNLWLSKWSTLMAIVSIGVCFFIVTAVLIGLYNLDIFSKKLSSKATIVIYIKNEIPETEIYQFINKLKETGFFTKIQYISKEDALKEMQNIIEPSMIELIGYNPLSNTVEAFIKDEKIEKIEEITQNIKKSDLVEDVYYPSKIIYALKTLKITLWNLGVIIFCFLSLAILFIIYATVKNHYWKKTEEIEILKLLGATPSYIRYPFITEGGILGLLGSLLATISIVIIYFFLHSKNVIEFLPAITQLVFPFEILYILPCIGLLLGVASSFVALGKIKYQ
ncbi:permease-like cell division protein FtsX [Thermodesulfovibrio sp. 1176]|uniref:cell division protein FtsX n=1 Tax=Thermodesulfovibrio sp. 1176 TaxID=3043424 RepID=UPI00248227E0|nr:permease-like cell division protein FtsX [Thermodesulfovibrio sp. 1176]MDI1472429.1 permease-like cell division protein FtsX [Thermodesulfovibrio sp. 1176]